MEIYDQLRAQIPHEQFTAYRKAREFAFELAIHTRDPEAWGRRLKEYQKEELEAVPSPAEPHFCSHCSKAVLDVTHDFNRDISGDATNPKPVIFPCSLGEVREGAADGCELFQLVLSQLKQPTLEEGEEGDYRLYCYASVDWDDPAVDVDIVISMGIIDTKKPWTKWRNENAQDTGASLGWMHVHCKPDDIAATYVSNRPVSLQPASTSTIARVKECLDECLTTHDASPSTVVQDSSTTHMRLISVSKENDRWALKLEDSPSTARYCTLSYCWGGLQPHATTVHNLEQRYTNLPFDELPRTIQDAVSVVSMLAIPYLWVDSICIVQDDYEQKLSNIAAMASVYANSTLTICVSRSLFADQGFLHQRTPYMNDARCFRIPYRLPTGEIGSIILSKLAGVARDNRLEERAWGFQERIMSSRILDFNGLTTSFTCPHKHPHSNFRDGGPVDSGKDWAAIDNLRLKFENVEQLLGDILLQDRAVERDPAAKDLWYDIVRAYTERDVTVPTDRALAIASIAERFGTITRDEYLAGMWVMGMPWSLMWSVRDRDQRLPRPQNTPEHYQGPSWSWTSINGPIHFWFSKQMYQDNCKIVFGMHGQDIDLVRNDAPYGAVHSGSLVLNGKIRKARWIRSDKVKKGGDYDYLACIDGECPLTNSESKVKDDAQTPFHSLELLPARIYPDALEAEFALPLIQGGLPELEVVLLRCFVQDGQPTGLVLREAGPDSGFYTRLGIFVSSEGQNERYTEDERDHDAVEGEDNSEVENAGEESQDETQAVLDQAKEIGRNLAKALQNSQREASVAARKATAWSHWKGWFDADDNEVQFLVVV